MMIADGASLAQAGAAGFTLGFGLIFSVGPRTLQLVRAGLAGFHPGASATTSYLSDVVLAAAATGGVGAALADHPALASTLQILGVGFLLWCGGRSLMRARRPAGPARVRPGPVASRRAAATAMLSVCWLNPLFYVEGLLVVGALAADFEATPRLAFAAGILAAAALKNYGWVAVGAAFGRRLSNPAVRRHFEAAAGAVLIVAAALLATRLAVAP
jgi:arginine exporter protein ArgO